MSVMFFGPIAAAIATGGAIYYLLRMLQDSDRVTADKLVGETARKPAA